MIRSLAFIPIGCLTPYFQFQRSLAGVARRRLINLAEILIAVWQNEIRLGRSLMSEAGGNKWRMERDGEGWEQLLAKIPWRCGRYSLVGRRRKTEEERRPHLLPKSEPLGKMHTSEEQFLQFHST